MQMLNRKLPRKLSQKRSLRSPLVSGASPGGRGSHVTIAAAAMPKRSQASRNTGNAATRSLDRPTYKPTRAIAAARQR
jgi:hypothetical protein